MGKMGGGRGRIPNCLTWIARIAHKTVSAMEQGRVHLKGAYFESLTASDTGLVYTQVTEIDQNSRLSGTKG